MAIENFVLTMAQVVFFFHTNNYWKSTHACKGAKIPHTVIQCQILQALSIPKLCFHMWRRDRGLVVSTGRNSRYSFFL